jgi:hypothetical protein
MDLGKGRGIKKKETKQGSGKRRECCGIRISSNFVEGTLSKCMDCVLVISRM